jgi:hypothetical protein
MSTIVDIDGTLLRNGSQPIHRVIDYVNALPGSVIIVTGRNVSERRKTEAALRAAGVKYSRLIMNPGSSADTAKYKEETGKKLKGSVNLAIDNNATMRAAYSRAGIKTMDPAHIANTTKGVIMDNFWDGTAFGKRTSKAMDESITPTQTGDMCTPDSINCMDKTCKMCATKPY